MVHCPHAGVVGVKLERHQAVEWHCHVGECGRPGRMRGVTTATPSYEGHRYPVEIINHCVWLYFRFPLSFREVEELMLVRGVAVSYETIRRWCAKFGQAYANQLRRRRPRPATSGTSTRCSSGSTAGCGTCGARSTSTATCSTFSSSHAETRWRPSDSSVSCSRACGTCRACWSPTSWAATRSPTARSCRRWCTGGRGI